MNRGLITRVRKYLDTPYLVTDEHLRCKIEAAKASLGSRNRLTNTTNGPSASCGGRFGF